MTFIEAWIKAENGLLTCGGLIIPRTDSMLGDMLRATRINDTIIARDDWRVI